MKRKRIPKIMENDANKTLLYAFVINCAVYLLMRIFFYARYECALDVMMQSAICGVSGRRSVSILYSHIFIGIALTALTTLLPTVSWQCVYITACVFLALLLITYVLIRRTANRVGMTVTVVFLCFTGYECYVRIGSMKTAAVLVAAMLMLLADYIETGRQKSWKQELWIAFPALVASMINFSVFLITAATGLFGMACYYKVRSFVPIQSWLNSKEAFRHLVSVLGCIVTTAVLLFTADDFNYRIRGLNHVVDNRWTMMRNYGYGMGEYKDSYMEDYGIDIVHLMR